MADGLSAFSQKLGQWFANPVQFVEEALQVKTVSSQQRDALEQWGRLLTAKDKQFKKQPLSTGS